MESIRIALKRAYWTGDAKHNLNSEQLIRLEKIALGKSTAVPREEEQTKLDTRRNI
jgi:hypothetical protein